MPDVPPITLVSDHNLTTHGQHRLPYSPWLLSLRNLEGIIQVFFFSLSILFFKKKKSPLTISHSQSSELQV